MSKLKSNYWTEVSDSQGSASHDSVEDDKTALERLFDDITITVKNTPIWIALITLVTTLIGCYFVLALFFFIGFINPAIFIGTAPLLTPRRAIMERQYLNDGSGDYFETLPSIFRMYILLNIVLYIVITILGFTILSHAGL